jgi:hypothetical protein
MLKSRRTARFSALPATEARAQKEKNDALALVKEICDLSAATVKPGAALVSHGSTAVLFPRLSALADKIMIEPEQLNEAAWLDQTLQTFGVQSRTVLYDIDPVAAQISSAAEAPAGADQALLFLFDAHIYPSEKQLLEAVQAAAKRLVVVFLRDVYDADYVKEGTLCLTNFGFRVCDIQAVLRKLFSPSAVPAQ